MKDLLVSLVQYFFENESTDEVSLKTLLKTILKILVFIIILSFGLWIALKLKK